MLASRPCSYCVALFSPARANHRFCTSTCRKLAFKAKKRSETLKKLSRRLETKLQKLAGSVFGKYLHKELLRAKTAQILTGHTAESLTDLVNLRRRCTAAGGYQNGIPLGEFELSHIYPVSGPQGPGLLHPMNLVICPKSYNRKHARSIPKEGYSGLWIEKSKVVKKWAVSPGATILESLKIARSFLGESFDQWLKSHQVSISQHKQLSKKLAEAGLPEQMLKTMALEELKALAEEEEVPYFNLNISPQKKLGVTLEESERFPIDEILKGALIRLYDIDLDWLIQPKYSFKGNDDELKTFQDFVIDQALNSIHGQSFNAQWRGKTFTQWFKVNKSRPYRSESSVPEEPL